MAFDIQSWGRLTNVSDSVDKIIENFRALKEDSIARPAYTTGIVTPVGNVTPTYVGQEYLNTTTGIWYKSIDLSSSNWKALN